MGFYANVIIPRFYDYLMVSPAREKARQSLLSGVQGAVLEVGFGTGLNLPHYPEHIRRITTVDINPGMNAKALERIRSSPIAVNTHVLDGARLPMEDLSFDSVVTAYSLCSIARVETALGEIHRVLKPGGRLFFLEHGLSTDPRIRRWQQRLNGVQKIIAAGCHLNRNIKALVAAQSFELVELEEFQMAGDPKTHGYTYQGIAVKPG